MQSNLVGSLNFSARTPVNDDARGAARHGLVASIDGSKRYDFEKSIT
jgi:hypothetical protein